MRLTDLSIRSLPFEADRQRDYPDTVVRGLSLRVGKQTKSFTVLLKSGSHRRRVKIGTYPAIGLAKARDLARDKLAEARVSKNELPHIKFADALENFYRIHGKQQREVTRIRCKYYLDKFFRERLAKRVLEAIKPADIATILDHIESAAVRRNVWAFIQAFFNWCYRRGYIDVSPVARVEAPPAPKPRDHVLSRDELLAIWNACPADDYGDIIKLCILTGQRIGQWMHFKPEYLTGDLVTWPANAMKSGKTHMLPVTPMIAGLVRPFSWKMNGSYKIRLDTACGVSDWRHHDLRRSWATIAAEELDIEPHIIESVLSHGVGTRVARTYNRAKYLDPMRKALLAFEKWLHLPVLKQEDRECLTPISQTSSLESTTG